MNFDILDRLRKDFASFPCMVAESLPTVDEISVASVKLGVPFTEDYAGFLQEFGGAMVGAYPIFGLRPVPVMGKQRWSVVEITKLFRQQMVPGTNKWILFSEDQAGNPVGFDSAGVIWTYDHDICEALRLFESFEDYIRERCLQLA